ncbi:hypothetical protein JJB09_02965 [Rhizobium sp. KVB221]|uniref:Sulfotransferase family protein n=1 Tax=Rhizobium setariae TaxID=2801340 RepID=A0A936YIN1_9HYPH|nr:hypothetical protein [Rhizobium setariae]MBL0370979.1 hypothetical protein [Rhizobium setariae]
MPRTVLHIGAHKTATTYMQKKLAVNVDALAARGIRYDPLDSFRKNVSCYLQDKDRANAKFIAELKSDIKTQDVLISEENIPGMPSDLVKSGVYYAGAKGRMRKFAKLLDIDTPEIFVGLREYSSLIVSMYSEYLRHREFFHFSEYHALYKKSKFTWMGLISDVVEVFPNARICVWDFSKFRTIEPEVFKAMLGQDASFLVAPEGPVRESFSEKALQVFETLSEILTHHELKGLIGPISRALPKGDTYKAFSPLPADVIAEMKVAYERDLRAIAARFPQIEFIGG